MSSNSIIKFEDENDFLSNFHPSPITIYYPSLDIDITFPTVEHAFQASKMVMPTEEGLQIFAAYDNPNKAKRSGRMITLRQDWETVKYRVMYDLIKLKFEQNPKLAKKLMKTYGMKLIEFNDWHDTTWGRCTCKECKGGGKNYLGKILKYIREELVHRERLNYLNNKFFTKTGVSIINEGVLNDLKTTTV